jgi:ABC-type transport system involved in multi-copper enzyme maturation permease subunit
VRGIRPASRNRAQSASKKNRMSSVIRSLVCKESVERRASLGLGVAWVVGGTVYAIADEAYFRVRAPVGTFYAVCLLYGLFAPVFLAMRTCLGEQTQGTMPFTSSLPASRRQIASVRLGGAVVTLVAPIILGALLLSLVLSGVVEQVPPRSDVVGGTSDITLRPALSGIDSVGLTWKVAAVSLAAATELFLILAAIGVRRRSEAHVGLIGAVVAGAWLTTTELPRTLREGAVLRGYEGAAATSWLGALLPESLVSPASYAGPHGSYQELEFVERVWGPLLLNVLVLLVLASLFVLRYGTLRAPAARRGSWTAWRLPPLFAHLPIRWRGRGVALTWLDLRQSVPIALAGFALAVLITAAGTLIKPAVTFARLPGTISIVALLWSGIVASVAFSSELQTGLGHFWRSRPIPVAWWFWTKFVVGLLAVVLVLDGIPAVLCPFPAEGEYQSLNRMSWAYLACMPLLHAMLYAIAVFVVCRLRRPVVAVVCSFAPFLLISIVTEQFPEISSYSPLAVYDKLTEQHPNPIASHYPVVYGCVAAIIVLAALASARAVHRWSRVAD